MQPSVLVTGGAGFIGSHACKILANAGYLPVTIDNLTTGLRHAVKWGPFIQGSIGNQGIVAEAIRCFKPVAALHFAGFISVGESVISPAVYYNNNVAQTLSFLDALIEGGVTKLVFSSSAAVYRACAKPIRLSERDPLWPESPYGRSKLIVENVLEDYAAAYGLQSLSLRYFNAAGADPDGEIGEAHDPETHLVPLVLQTALGERPQVEMYGTNFSTSDGTCVRDFVHVSDLAEGHLKALDLLLGYLEPSHRALNLGSGQGCSVKEVIETARKMTGCEIAVRDAPARKGDQPYLIADTQMAQKLLDWMPQRSSLETIIGDAWRWHASRNKSADSCNS